MRLDTKAFAIAAGTTAAVLFTLCALAVAIAPGPSMAFFGYLAHMDLSALPLTLTFASFIVGLIGWTVGTALTFGLAAAIYNRLVGASPVVQVAGHQPPAAQRA